MQDLEADKVIMAWPKPGSAAMVDLVDGLPSDLKSSLDDPRQYLLPLTELSGFGLGWHSSTPGPGRKAMRSRKCEASELSARQLS